MSTAAGSAAFRLDGRLAVVTGAAGAIGAAISAQLQALGATVVDVDISHPATPQSVAGGLQVGTDISDADATAALGALVRARWGRCDVLVNNAAITAGATPLEHFPLDAWDRVLGVNLRGPLLMAQSLVPLMLERGSGSIVNITSIAAHAPSRNGAYATAKAGLLGLTQQMAVEWGPRGLRANSVSPGMVLTPLSAPHYQVPGKRELREQRIPARRIGQPTDIAGAVAFLASDAAAYVNGQDLVVDGGFLKAPLHSLY